MQYRYLMTPGRMDVIERALISSRFFQGRMRRYGTKRVRNRRNIRKRYNGLTVRVATSLAKDGLDPMLMRGEEIRARALEVVMGHQLTLAAA
jgi:hypothetical protein